MLVGRCGLLSGGEVMPQGAIARKLRREAEARALVEAPGLVLRRGPEPMLTVRLAETPIDADLAPLTAEAYPVPETGTIEPVPGTKKRGRRKKEAEDARTEGQA